MTSKILDVTAQREGSTVSEPTKVTGLTYIFIRSILIVKII